MKFLAGKRLCILPKTSLPLKNAHLIYLQIIMMGVKLYCILNEPLFIKRGDVMPKIIKDLEKTIRNSAFELFTKLSYTDVDMKMIAKKSGIAVGTLYNYYQNKKQLYVSILKESWRNTFSKLDSISELTTSPGEKLGKFISTLYADIEARNGLGKALINTSVVELKDDKEIDDLKNSLVLRVENLLNCFDKVETLSKGSNLETRLAESLIVSMLVMLEFHPKEKEENINFLVELVSLSIKAEKQ